MKRIDATIKEYFNEWNEHINKIPVTQQLLEKCKDELFYLKQEMDGKTDYNDLYGKNNDKVREAHYKKFLAPQYSNIQELDDDLEYRERRISFIKSRINYLLILKKEMGKI